MGSRRRDQRDRHLSSFFEDTPSFSTLGFVIHCRVTAGSRGRRIKAGWGGGGSD